MKSYNVKSNAKRFARGLVAKYPGKLEAAEPVEVKKLVGDRAVEREWFPAVLAVAEFSDGEREAINAVAVVYGFLAPASDPFAALDAALNAEAEVGHEAISEIVSEHLGLYVSPEEVAEDLAEASAERLHEPEAEQGNDVTDMVGVSALHPAPVDSVEPGEAMTLATKRTTSFPGARVVNVSTPQEGRDYVVRGGVNVPLDKPHPDYTRPVPGKDEPSEPTVVMKAAAVGKTEISAAGLAATLPPPAKSTPEEIAQRRAERRARIDAGEYAAPAPTAKEKRETKGQTILRMASQEGGAAAEDIAAACGWQAHTLRGYIGGTLRKRLKAIGKTIEAVRKSGEPTRYVVTDLPADNATA